MNQIRVKLEILFTRVVNYVISGSLKAVCIFHFYDNFQQRPYFFLFFFCCWDKNAFSHWAIFPTPATLLCRFFSPYLEIWVRTVYYRNLEWLEYVLCLESWNNVVKSNWKVKVIKAVETSLAKSQKGWNQKGGAQKATFKSPSSHRLTPNLSIFRWDSMKPRSREPQGDSKAEGLSVKNSEASCPRSKGHTLRNNKHSLGVPHPRSKDYNSRNKAKAETDHS